VTESFFDGSDALHIGCDCTGLWAITAGCPGINEPKGFKTAEAACACFEELCDNRAMEAVAKRNMDGIDLSFFQQRIPPPLVTDTSLISGWSDPNQMAQAGLGRILRKRERSSGRQHRSACRNQRLGKDASPPARTPVVRLNLVVEESSSDESCDSSGSSCRPSHRGGHSNQIQIQIAFTNHSRPATVHGHPGQTFAMDESLASRNTRMPLQHPESGMWTCRICHRPNQRVAGVLPRRHS